MPLALQADSSAVAYSPSRPATRRSTKHLVAGIAVASAGVLAVNPVTPSLPDIQQRAVELPPALLLFALFGFGALYGLPGLLLAAPLTVVVYVLVKKLYVRELLDTETSVPGEDDQADAGR